jgi:hypothetical protein
MAVDRSGRGWLGWALGTIVLLALLLAAVIVFQPLWSDWLFQVTGEESLAGQVRGGFEYLGNITRPRPETADLVPVANAGVNPFGVNTFLQEEVEPQKRELAVQMMADAGFEWIRQEFTWEDIEIHGKGDFEDRRHEPYRSSWEKYDHIVDLADQYGLQIIARISNPPAWSRAQGDEAGTLAPPDDLADYGDFVEEMVRRYQGRIHYYQIWNEPNIYPEWGERPVSPEEYTELLKVGYSRVKGACPDCVVISGALAQTIPLGPRDLNDFIFLQRMYDAGAGDYFDVLAMQGYGLWSGPTDRRMRPRVLNFSRPLYLREIMVENGDAGKPIWITEMNWNAPPPDLPNKAFGFVTPEQQARYAVLAYRRAQQEWPWLGVINFWFFKRATDSEKDQAMYYFRMVEPDFTATPVYHVLREYTRSGEPQILYSGVHQEDHWALAYSGEWQVRPEPDAELGQLIHTDDPQASLSFVFEGTDLTLKAGPGPDTELAFSLDGTPEQKVRVPGGGETVLGHDMPGGQHIVSIRAASGPLAVDSVTIQDRISLQTWLLAAGVIAALVLIVVLVTSVIARRRRWYERSRALR